MRTRSRVGAVLAGAALTFTLVACSSGAALRVTTSAAVSAALTQHDVKYKGDLSCRGNQLPIDCTGTATDGRPISATLTATSSNACMLAVRVGGQLVAQTSGSRCR